MEFIKIPMAFKTKWVLGLGSRGEIWLLPGQRLRLEPLPTCWLYTVQVSVGCRRDYSRRRSGFQSTARFDSERQWVSQAKRKANKHTTGPHQHAFRYQILASFVKSVAVPASFWRLSWRTGIKEIIVFFLNHPCRQREALTETIMVVDRISSIWTNQPSWIRLESRTAPIGPKSSPVLCYSEQNITFVSVILFRFWMRV
jgi:hypothetical protein